MVKIKQPIRYISIDGLTTDSTTPQFKWYNPTPQKLAIKVGEPKVI